MASREEGRGRNSRTGEGVEAWAVLAGKAMSHPARIAVLRTLARKGIVSPSDAAGIARVSLGTCAYHMRTLMSLGLIQVQGTQPVRGALEHFYELTNDGQHVVRAIEEVIARAPRRSRRGAG
jgi:predicted ArsR family transcriptional regulator